MDHESGGSAKDLFKLIVHSPALLVTVLVGIGLVVYLLVKNGPSSSQNATGGVSGAAAPTATVIPQTSIYVPQHVYNQSGPSASDPTTGQVVTPVQAAFPPSNSTPPGPVASNPAVPSPVASVPGTSTSTQTTTQTSYTARLQGNSTSTAGIGIRNQPGGPGTTTTRNVAYGQNVQIIGPPVQGQSNNPVTKGVANTNLWYPVAGGGYVSAADVVAH